MTAVEADRLKVRLDGKEEEVEAWLPAEGELAHEKLAAWIGSVRPGSRVALVCHTLGGRLVVRAAAAVR